MIKVLLFDADGVLVLPSDKFFSERLSDEFDIPLSAIMPFFEGPYKECLLGKKDLKQALVPYISQWGWQGTVEDLLEYWFSLERNLNQELMDYVDQLHADGIRCFVATNSETYRAEYMFSKIGASGSFEFLYAAGKLGVAKPDQAYFQYILDDLAGTTKDEVLFWDDQQQHVEAARRFGICAEHYTDVEDFKKTMQGYLNA